MPKELARQHLIGINHDFGSATIIGNSFTDYIRYDSTSITVTGTFHSSTSVTGRYTVVAGTPGASCSVDVTWTAHK